MKSSTKFLIFLISLLPAINDATAQKAVFTTNGGINIGFGLGASYQRSDVLNSIGGGFDFTFGSYLYKRENAFLSADWKFRFLTGENAAFDHRINTSASYNNVKLLFFTYDAEIGLTLNRLKERTRIVITGFAGPGITHGITYVDLLNADGNPYDYSSVDPNRSRREIYSDLLNLSDGDFETKIQGKAALLPTAGIYIGYQFSRSFTMGLEHKVNFSLTENNSFSGIDIDNAVLTDSRRDRNSYTSLIFRWSLGRGSAGRATRITYPVISTPVVTRPVPQTVIPEKPHPVITKAPPPEVDIIIPYGSTHETTSGTIEITARVSNVRGKQDIRVLLNGNNSGFDYNPVYRNVKASLPLTEGKNILRITASNESGNAGDETVILYKKTSRPAFPALKFVNPPEAVTVEKNIFPVTVQTRNIKEWQDISVTVNGAGFTNFNFLPEGTVTFNAALREGVNVIEVRGKNESGTASDRASITFTRTASILPPSVTIVDPGKTPYTTNESLHEIRAIISGVRSKENISFTINGTSSGAFSFDAGTRLLTARISLREGGNNITVNARNEAGQDGKSVVITREVRPCPSPVLRMIEPAQVEVITDKPLTAVRAGTMNIASKDQLTLRLNDNAIPDFGFSGSEVSASISLKEGLNTLVISALTGCGSSSISYSFFYKPPVVPPVVEKPCPVPVLNLAVAPVSGKDDAFDLKASAVNIRNRNDIIVTISGNRLDNFSFEPSTGSITASLKLEPGTHSIKVEVKNECGTDSKITTVTVKQPCFPPQINLTLTAVNTDDATHLLKGTISNIKEKSSISITVNGKPFDSFSFVQAGGTVSASFSFNPGTYTVMAEARNECGEESFSRSVTVEEKPCGVRINPGNSAWEFCLVTPSGTFSRDTLTNRNFTYSGPATSLYFMPIAGGGDAIVQGKAFQLRSGQYYLFTGSLNVKVSTRNPGSMGQWSVCITSNRVPVSGNGNNRPQSPCEETADAGKQKKKDEK